MLHFFLLVLLRLSSSWFRSFFFFPCDFPLRPSFSRIIVSPGLFEGRGLYPDVRPIFFNCLVGDYSSCFFLRSFFSALRYVPRLLLPPSGIGASQPDSLVPPFSVKVGEAPVHPFLTRQCLRVDLTSGFLSEFFVALFSHRSGIAAFSSAVAVKVDALVFLYASLSSLASASFTRGKMTVSLPLRLVF